MKIGLDLDDILADCMPALLQYHNDIHGTVLSLEDHKHFELERIWGCSREEAIRRVQDFFETSYFRNIIPVDGAQEGVKRLREHHEIFVITSRAEIISRETGAWVERYFQESFTSCSFDKFMG